MTEKKRESVQARTFEFDLASRGEGDSIPVVVSTDSIVEMPDGPEILVHTPDAIDLRRAPLPITVGHRDSAEQINVGIVDGLKVQDGKLRGLARFGQRPEAAGYRTDVMSGIIRSVSVKYRRIHGRVRQDGVLVTDQWMPIHTAMLSEPADVNAGFYREAADSPPFVVEHEAAKVSTAITQADAADTHERKAMDEQQAPAGNGNGALPSTVSDGALRERLRIQAIDDLCDSHHMPPEQRAKWKADGTSENEACRQTLQVLYERTKNNPQSEAKVGLTEKETKTYSVWKAIRAMDQNNWKDAGFELEVNRTLCNKLNRSPESNTILIPFEVLQRQNPQVRSGGTFLRNGLPAHQQYFAQRDLAVASGGGEYLVESTNQGFIEMLRNRSVCLRAGVERMTGLVGNVNIPKQSAAATAYWLSSETATITESAQTLVQIPLTPHTAGAYTEISRLLLLQSSPDAEGIVMRDLSAVTAIAVDLAVIAGSNSGGQPQGIIGTANVGSVTGTSFDAADIIEFQSDVASSNVMPARGAYVTTPTVAGLCMTRATFTSGVYPLWVGNVWDGTMMGFPCFSSMQIPTGDMMFGDWSTVTLAEWGVLELAVNPAANFAAGIIGIRAMYSMDVGVRIPVAFSVMTSAT